MEKLYNILDNLNLTIDITRNKYNLNFEKIISLGARKNIKRSFLFINNYLGKHIPNSPLKSIFLGELLARELLKDDFTSCLSKALNGQMINSDMQLLFEDLQNNKLLIKEKTLFIGFAETATGLGHSVFNAFSGDISFIHTTREEIPTLKSSFDFQEEHSHATSHYCFSKDDEVFKNVDHIVLIDDEFSTGKTNLNLIGSLTKKFSIKKFTCMAILDWRNTSNIQKYKNLEKKLGISIEVKSLIKGSFVCNEKTTISNITPPLSKKNIINSSCDLFLSPISQDQCIDEDKSYVLGTGRFGITNIENKNNLSDILSKVKKLDVPYCEDETLILGFGEFIFIPLYIAANIFPNSRFASPSLSPIYTSLKEDYPLNNVFNIPCPYNSNNIYNIYNISENKFKQVILILEKLPSSSFIEEFRAICKSSGINSMHLIYLTTL